MSGPDSPSASTPRTTSSEGPPETSRRRFVAAVGTAASVGVAGCSERVPGTGPEEISTEMLEDSGDRLAWSFPPRAGDAEGIGYVEVQRERRLSFGDDVPAMRFHFNASVPLSNDYELDRFRARLRTPKAYYQRYGDVTYLVEPPGQWEQFRTRYHREPTFREVVFAMDGIDADGTIQVPFVLFPRGRPLPSALRCEFSVRLSKPGWVGKSVTASGRGSFAFDPSE